MELVADGAVAILGNHDSAIGNAHETNDESAPSSSGRAANSNSAQRRFLSGLPLSQEQGDCLFVHADASKPASWRYVMNADDAARSIDATRARLTLCGHVHRPALYCKSATGKMISFTPTTGVAVQLLPGRRWLAVLGSVGQPRDGNPAASYLMFDTAKDEVTFCRAAYDIQAAAERIRMNGLPTRLAERLFVGE